MTWFLFHCVKKINDELKFHNTEPTTMVKEEMFARAPCKSSSLQ